MPWPMPADIRKKLSRAASHVRHAGDTKEVYLSTDSAAQIYPGDVVRIPSSLFWDTISVLGPLSGFAALYGAYHN